MVAQVRIQLIYLQSLASYREHPRNVRDNMHFGIFFALDFLRVEAFISAADLIPALGLTALIAVLGTGCSRVPDPQIGPVKGIEKASRHGRSSRGK